MDIPRAMQHIEKLTGLCRRPKLFVRQYRQVRIRWPQNVA